MCTKTPGYKQDKHPYPDYPYNYTYNDDPLADDYLPEYK